MVGDVWPHVKGYIEAATDAAGDYTAESIERSLLNEDQLLWVIAEDKAILAAVVTELYETEREKVCNIVACGGTELRRWRHLLPQLEDYARAEGCATTRMAGRPGWQKVFPDYSVAFVTLEKKLEQ